MGFMSTPPVIAAIVREDRVLARVETTFYVQHKDSQKRLRQDAEAEVPLSRR